MLYYMTINYVYLLDGVLFELYEEHHEHPNFLGNQKGYYLLKTHAKDGDAAMAKGLAHVRAHEGGINTGVLLVVHEDGEANEEPSEDVDLYETI